MGLHTMHTRQGQVARPGMCTFRQRQPWIPSRRARHVIQQAQPDEVQGWPYHQQSEGAAGGSAVHTVHPSTAEPELQQLASVLSQESQFSLDLKRLQAFAAYKSELQKHPEDVDILKCAVLIAKATKYPQASEVEVAAHVDRLAAEVEKQLTRSGNTRYPMHVLRTILRVMYDQQGWHGNIIDYYDDDNSMMNMVLTNKAGIPLSLSLLFMEVARRVGLPMKGVNLPARFMIIPDVEDLEVLVDAFAGEVLFVEDAEAKLSQLMQVPIRLDPTHVMARKGVPPRQFLMRLLNNLKQIYIQTSQVDLALRVIRLMRVTQPDAGSELRDEGLCLYSMARYTESAQALEAYLKACPQAADVGQVHSVLQGCRILIQEQWEEQQRQGRQE